jgi:hypothetical protein
MIPQDRVQSSCQITCQPGDQGSVGVAERVIAKSLICCHQIDNL